MLAEWLMAQGVATSGTFEQIEQRVRTEVEVGEQFALDAPYPDPSEVEQDVYA